MACFLVDNDNPISDRSSTIPPSLAIVEDSSPLGLAFLGSRMTRFQLGLRTAWDHFRVINARLHAWSSDGLSLVRVTNAPIKSTVIQRLIRLRGNDVSRCNQTYIHFVLLSSEPSEEPHFLNYFLVDNMNPPSAGLSTVPPSLVFVPLGFFVRVTNERPDPFSRLHSSDPISTAATILLKTVLPRTLVNIII
jgi:hypothetical protein